MHGTAAVAAWGCLEHVWHGREETYELGLLGSADLGPPDWACCGLKLDP